MFVGLTKLAGTMVMLGASGVGEDRVRMLSCNLFVPFLLNSIHDLDMLNVFCRISTDYQDSYKSISILVKQILMFPVLFSLGLYKPHQD